MAVVIIPAYKPGKKLAAIADELWSCGCRILVVDDGSGEEYKPVFDKVSDICIILHHPENKGKGAAIKTALSYIQNEIWDNDVVGVMDADGQHLTKDMMKVLEAAQRHKKALVLGVRSVGEKMPLKSRVGNQITRMVFRLASGVFVSDTQTGLRAFGTELIPKLLAVEGERYEYEMNVLMFAAKMKIPIKEVAIDTIYCDKNNSGSHFRIIRDSVRIYRDILKFTLSSFSSFLVDYALFAGLMLIVPHTSGSILGANIAARVVSAFYNYSMNCRFVFHTERRAHTLAGYIALAFFIFIMNSVILEFFTQVCGISVYPAKLMTECLLFCLSWLIQNMIIFRKEKYPRIEIKKEVNA